MKMTIISGSNPDVYKFVGPFAMNKSVVAEFEGYPLLNNDRMTWFIIIENDQVLGFAAIDLQGDIAEFTNAYIIPEKRDKGLYQELYNERMNFCKTTGIIKKVKAICSNDSIEFYRQHGFTVVKSYVKWHKIEKTL